MARVVLVKTVRDGGEHHQWIDLYRGRTAQAHLTMSRSVLRCCMIDDSEHWQAVTAATVRDVQAAWANRASSKDDYFG